MRRFATAAKITMAPSRATSIDAGVRATFREAGSSLRLLFLGNVVDALPHELSSSWAWQNTPTRIATLSPFVARLAMASVGCLSGRGSGCSAPTRVRCLPSMFNALRRSSHDLIEALSDTRTDRWSARFCVALCLIPVVPRSSALFNVVTARGLDSSRGPAIAAAEALLHVTRPWARRR